MHVRKMLAGFSLLCFAVGTADGRAQALSAEIKLAQTVVKNNEDISVTTTIRNTGAAEETLVVWTCSYPAQWRADNPDVRVYVIPCQQNVPEKLKLRPGESYARPVRVHVALKAPERCQSVTFRLGYGTDAYFGTIEPAPKSPAIWSNVVTVPVVLK
jgi:hypothetical protein